jgi:hypothetical protein
VDIYNKDMIKEKYLNIKICNPNIIYYKSKGFNCKFGEIIKVPIELVNKNSHIKITSICNNCGVEKMNILRNYYKCMNTSELKIYLCSKCSHIKNENTCLKKYGVSNHMKFPEIKEKIKNTCLKKYGVEHYSKTEEFKNKTHNTNFKKYGKHYFQTDKFKNKNKKILLEKYGVEYPMQSEIIKNKSKNTCLKKYGVSNVSKIEEIKNKKIITSLKNYDVKYPMQSKIIKDKMKLFCNEKYGCDHEMQNLEYFNNWLLKTYKIKYFKNTELFYQGSYELDFLENFENKFYIKNGLSFNYFFDNNKKVYFSDFYLPDFNLIIEIKSSYTFQQNKSINLLKEKTVLNSGYNFIFIIDKNYLNFLKIIELNVLHISS